MKVKQISVVLDTELDNPEKMMTVLTEHNVDVIAMTITQSGSFSVVRILMNNVLWASSALWEAGFTVNMSDVIAVGVPEGSECLGKALGILNEAGIRVKYMYTANCRRTRAAVMRFTDNDAAVSALSKAGIWLLSPGDIA